MTIREALQWARRQLSQSPTPYEDARLLLQHVLAAGHATLAAHPERALSATEEQQYRAYVARAARLEPIPYITGTASFAGLEFRVTPDVLIPRPETELLVEAAVAWGREHEAQRVVDVGTGSGCVAVLLALRLPEAEIVAIDLSAAALEVARHNSLQHGLGEAIRLQQGSLLEGVTQEVDLIVANLPYISDVEWTALDDGVKWYEPVEALRGGPDGLILIGSLLQQATSRLRPRGAIFLEIGWQQGSAAQSLAQATFPSARVNVLQDYAGHDRIVTIETAD